MTRIADCEIGSACTIFMSHLARASVGSGTRIGPYANIRPHTSLGEGVKIGNFVELKNAEVGRNAMEQEIRIARHHPGLAHQRPVARALGESFQLGVGLAVQADEAEGDHVEAECRGIEERTVAVDDAGRLQPLDAPQAGRGRDADPARQFDIGHPAVVLEFLEDLPVDGIEFGFHGHGQFRIAKSAFGPI